MPPVKACGIKHHNRAGLAGYCIVAIGIMVSRNVPGCVFQQRIDPLGLREPTLIVQAPGMVGGGSIQLFKDMQGITPGSKTGQLAAHLPHQTMPAWNILEGAIFRGRITQINEELQTLAQSGKMIDVPGRHRFFANGVTLLHDPVACPGPLEITIANLTQERSVERCFDLADASHVSCASRCQRSVMDNVGQRMLRLARPAWRIGFQIRDRRTQPLNLGSVKPVIQHRQAIGPERHQHILKVCFTSHSQSSFRSRHASQTCVVQS
ncbi:MAG: hypothetical protein P8Q36_01240 [Alphaproteobacteria bacterium]|nr:hypothetical protein [Alphaproteobacteria bacterium]